MPDDAFRKTSFGNDSAKQSVWKRATMLEEELLHRHTSREILKVEEILVEDKEMSEKATITRKKPRPPFPPCYSFVKRHPRSMEISAICASDKGQTRDETGVWMPEKA